MRRSRGGALVLAGGLLTATTFGQPPVGPSVVVTYQCADLVTVVRVGERCPRAEPVAPPPGFSGMFADADRARRANDAAAQNLQRAQEFLASLDRRLRDLVSTLEPAQQQSLVELAGAVAERVEMASQARAVQRRRLDALTMRLRSFDGDLLRLRQEGRVLLSEADALQAELADLEPLAATRRDWLLDATHDAEQLSAALDAAWDGARSARAKYWEAAGAFFERAGLGTPRDYVPRVAYLPATTRRGNVIQDNRIKTIRPISRVDPFPYSRTVAAPASVGGQARATDLAAAAGSPDEVGRLTARLQAWSNALDESARLEQHGDELVDRIERTMADVRRQSEAVAAQSRLTGQLDQQLRSAKEQNAALALQLNATTALVKDRVESLWDAARQTAFWEVAEASLQQVVSPVAGAAVAVRYFGWLIRQYGTFLKEDLPAAIELLGGNPSAEAREKYDRLLDLSTETGKEFAMTMWGASGAGPSVRRQRQWQRVADGSYRTPSGLRFGPPEHLLKAPRGEDVPNSVFHLMRHTKAITEPQVARNFKSTISDLIESEIFARPKHGMFDGSMKDVIGLVEEGYQRVRQGQAQVLKSGGGTTTYLIDMGRRIGYQDGYQGRHAGGPAATHMILAVKGQAQDGFVTAFVCAEGFCN